MNNFICFVLARLDETWLILFSNCKLKKNDSRPEKNVSIEINYQLFYNDLREKINKRKLGISISQISIYYFLSTS